MPPKLTKANCFTRYCFRSIELETLLEVAKEVGLTFGFNKTFLHEFLDAVLTSYEDYFDEKVEYTEDGYLVFFFFLGFGS